MWVQYRPFVSTVQYRPYVSTVQYKPYVSKYSTEIWIPKPQLWVCTIHSDIILDLYNSDSITVQLHRLEFEAQIRVKKITYGAKIGTIFVYLRLFGKRHSFGMYSWKLAHFVN